MRRRNDTDQPMVKEWCVVAAHYDASGTRTPGVDCNYKSHNIGPNEILAFEETETNGPYIISITADMTTI